MNEINVCRRADLERAVFIGSDSGSFEVYSFDHPGNGPTVRAKSATEEFGAEYVVYKHSTKGVEFEVEVAAAKWCMARVRKLKKDSSNGQY